MNSKLSTHRSEPAFPALREFAHGLGQVLFSLGILLMYVAAIWGFCFLLILALRWSWSLAGKVLGLS